MRTIKIIDKFMNYHKLKDYRVKIENDNIIIEFNKINIKIEDDKLILTDSENVKRVFVISDDIKRDGSFSLSDIRISGYIMLQNYKDHKLWIYA